MKFDTRTGEFRELSHDGFGLCSFEALIPLFTSAAGGTAAVAGTAAAASGSGFFAALKTGLTIAGAGASILGGFATARGLEDQARLDELQAEREEIRGIEASNDIQRELLKRLAANVATGGGSGLTLEGTFDTVQEELQADAERQTSISRVNAATAAGAERISASTRRSSASGARLSGVGRGATSLLSLVPENKTPTKKR